MQFRAPPGLTTDAPFATGGQRWRSGFNVRWRNGLAETMGLFRPLRDLIGNPIKVNVATYGPARTIRILPGASKAQVIVGCLNGLFVLEPHPDSSLSTGTRWRLSNITPASLAAATDTPGIDLGRVRTSPAWWIVSMPNAVVVGRGGLNEAVYQWDRDPAHVATAITAAPKHAVAAGLTDGNHLILLGVDSVGTDPYQLISRWPNRNTLAEWTPGVLSTSGELLVNNASRLVGGGRTSLGVVGWTDSGMWLWTETGKALPAISRQEVARVGLLAQNMWCEADGRLWWIGSDRAVWMYEGGRPQAIPCPISRETFDLLSREAMHRGWAHAVAEFNEVWFWIPNGTSQEPDRAAVYNWAEQCWTIARFDRTAMCDRVGVLRPLAVGRDGTIYEHEAAVVDDTPTWQNDQPEPREWSLTTSMFSPSENPEAETIDLLRVILDQVVTAPFGVTVDAIDLTFSAYENMNPNGNVKVATQQWGEATERAGLRLGGRTVDMTISATDRVRRVLGDIWLKVQQNGSER